MKERKDIFKTPSVHHPFVLVRLSGYFSLTFKQWVQEIERNDFGHQKRFWLWVKLLGTCRGLSMTSKLPLRMKQKARRVSSLDMLFLTMVQKISRNFQFKKDCLDLGLLSFNDRRISRFQSMKLDFLSNVGVLFWL